MTSSRPVYSRTGQVELLTIDVFGKSQSSRRRRLKKMLLKSNMSSITFFVLAVLCLSAACGVLAAPATTLSDAQYAAMEKTHSQLLAGLQPGEDPVLNIKTFGAVGDGVHNDTSAFLKAMLYASVFKPWTVLIPEGTFLIYPATFPCHNTRLAIRGTVLAPENPAEWWEQEYYWRIQEAENCTITGYTESYEDLGIISGQGSRWWNEKPGAAPSLIYFDGVSSDYEAYPVAGVFNISLVNSPGTHISVTRTRWYSSFSIAGVDIYSPENSRTVGVEVVNASVRFSNNKISTGADNIILMCGRGDSNRVFAGGDYNEFGTGDGISVIMYDGIMGNITFYASKFRGTRFGMRVMGAVDGTGSIINVGLESTTMEDVGIPLWMDNTACPAGRHDCTGKSQGQEGVLSMLDIV